MFRNPWIFLLMIPIIALVVFPFFMAPRQTSGLSRWKSLDRSWRRLFWWLPELWDALVLSSLVLVLAGPEVAAAPEETQHRGLSLAVVLDRSASMGAMVDYGENQISRFDGVKGVLKEFFRRRPDDAVTLISFAGFPETHTPLTSNPDVLSGFLDIIPLALEGKEGGTAIGDALVLAAARLRNARAPGEKNTGAIILLTDGKNNSGEAEPDEGARTAAALGIKIFPIGLGGKGILRLENQSAEAVELDVKGLERLAKISKGAYFQADSLQSLDGLMKALEDGQLSTLKTFQVPIKRLELEPGLWVFLILTLGSPFVRVLFMRRFPE